MDAGYTHSFPAVRGLQAGRGFYVATCPLRIIPKIFIFDEDEVPPELRAQRTLNRARLPEITSYIVDNPDSYVISALTASVAAQVSFEPLAQAGARSNLGVLHIPMDAHILINDGQHRRAAIEEALKERPELGNESVPVVFFEDEGLERSQQMFADLNKHAVRPSDSISTLYDRRDDGSSLARYLAMSVSAFQGMTELEKSSISNRSTKLFTLSGIKNATRALLQKSARASISAEEQKFAFEYWAAVSNSMPDWLEAKSRRLSAQELRQNFVHVHGVTLHALGIVGRSLSRVDPQRRQTILENLSSIDWARSNKEAWEGRAMHMGKISKARLNVQLTANAIKRHLGIELSQEEMDLEELYSSGRI